MSRQPSHHRPTAARWLPGLVLAMIAGASQIPAQQDASVSSGDVKMNSTPNFQQTDPQGGFPGDGRQYCAPVAVSNSLMELAENGWPDLLPNGAHGKQAQIALIFALASPGFMDTSLDDGTSAGSLMRGVEAWIRQTPYKVQYLKYEGFRKVPPGYRAGTVPDPAWFQRGVRDPNSAVWLNVGWYRYDPANDAYDRIGGHWVTLVGYGTDRHGKPSPNILVIHNPWQQAGRTISDDFVATKEISSGSLTNAQSQQLWGLPRRAQGYFLLSGDIHPKKGADTAIIDGAVVMTLQR